MQCKRQTVHFLSSFVQIRAKGEVRVMDDQKRRRACAAEPIAGLACSRLTPKFVCVVLGSCWACSTQLHIQSVVLTAFSDQNLQYSAATETYCKQWRHHHNTAAKEFQAVASVDPNLHNTAGEEFQAVASIDQNLHNSSQRVRGSGVYRPKPPQHISQRVSGSGFYTPKPPQHSKSFRSVASID